MTSRPFDTSPFRRRLAVRLVHAVACASPLAVLAATGCDRTVTIATGSGAGVGGSGGASPTTSGNPTGYPTTSVSSTTTYSSYSAGPGGYSTDCIPWPPGGTTSAVSGSSATVTTGSGGPPPPCPSQADAYNYFPHYSCGVAAVASPGTFVPGQGCCYTVVQQACSGRPFLVEDEAVTSPLVRSAGRWGRASLTGFEPDATRLSPEARRVAAEAWARDGALEHASIASFGRFALELMAAGAPAELVEEAHRAAVDEVRHARLCFELASTYAGESIAPGAFPFGGAVVVEEDLASIAARAVREGCVGETLAATFAAEQLARATDPTVRRVLAAIAEDESRHAELAWRAVAWAIRRGGERVRAAVVDAFAAALDVGAAPSPEVDALAGELAAHGRLSQEMLAAAAVRAREEIILPALHALLGANRAGEKTGLDARSALAVEGA